MLISILVIIFSIVVIYATLNAYAPQLKHPMSTFGWLLVYHYLFFGLYYVYALSTGSDSVGYYARTVTKIHGDNWLDYYGTGTDFIEFVNFPLVNYLGFDYTSCMLLFALLGYLGFIFFYLFFVNFFEYRHKLWGIDFIVLLMFLPNMHFWAVSLGKGSIIFFGFGMLFYGMLKPVSRLIPLLLGALLIYHVRSHLILIVLLSIILSSVFSSKGLTGFQKFAIFTLAMVAIIPVLGSFMETIRIDEIDLDTLEDIATRRSGSLSRATSGVDISNYNQGFKLFTFLFRPLFVDAPNSLGLIISFENTFYLLVLLRIMSWNFLRFLVSGPWIVKVAFLSFLGSSLALAQVSGNLGLATRQKAQVMYLFFFVIVAYADWVYNNYGKKVIGD